MSNLVTLFDRGSSLSWAGVQPSLQLVKDPYSNKYYGTDTYDQVVNTVRAYQQEAQQAYDRANSPFPWNNNGITAEHPNLISSNETSVNLKENLTSALAIPIPSKEDYIQSNDIINSYKTYGADWDAFFQRSYQNPRVEEENRNKRARTQQSQQRNQTLASNLQDLLVEASSMPTSKKVTNTGISSKADVFGGRLEAGLGV